MKTKRSQQTSPAWDAWYDSYLNYYQDVEKKAAGTIRDARCTLNRVSWWLHDQGISERLWQVSFHTYLAWLEASRRRGMSPRTLGKCISHLNMFLTFSYRSGRCECNVLKGFRLQDTTRPSKPRWLTVDEARRLIFSSISSQLGEQKASYWLSYCLVKSREALTWGWCLCLFSCDTGDDNATLV